MKKTVATALCIGLAAISARGETDGAKTASRVVYAEDFEGDDAAERFARDWWVEGGEKVSVQNGRLRVEADPKRKGHPGYVCTVWNRKTFSGDVRVEFEAHVLSSSLGVNNINFFLCYSDPNGKPLYDTRKSRASGAYPLYHKLNGYIFTFLAARRKPGAEKTGRFRMRRCPGFKLITEKFDYHCRKGVTYRVAITKRGGRITYAVDGKVYLETTDDKPWASGLIGLRTFRTDLWWDNLNVTQLGAAEASATPLKPGDPDYRGVLFSSTWSHATGDSLEGKGDGKTWVVKRGDPCTFEVRPNGPTGENYLSLWIDDTKWGDVWKERLGYDKYQHTCFRFYMRVHGKNIKYTSGHFIQDYEERGSTNFYFGIGASVTYCWSLARNALL